VATGGGVWAPTIRYRDGVFYIIVTIAMSPRGCVVFTAADPAGPWSDGITIDGVGGIDPDLAWDDDGTAYVTFSGLSTSGEQLGQHLGIQQVRVDLEAGKALEAPRSLWSGAGLKFPEAPHLYQSGDFWYLVIAEGGTERGHGVSVVRGPSPERPLRRWGRAVSMTGAGKLVLSWGSAVAGSAADSEIFAAPGDRGRLALFVPTRGGDHGSSQTRPWLMDTGGGWHHETLSAHWSALQA